MCAYSDTLNKQIIREGWDGTILRAWSARLDRPLTYLGLPGPDIKDFLDWSDVLAAERTGVESPGRSRKERSLASETIGQLHTNVMVHGLSSGFQLLRADIEDVILNGVDDDGNPPQLNDGRASHLARFSYDLINLDFDGGFGYRNQLGPSRRAEAIKRLFERQEGRSFILLLTINVRDTLGEAVEEYLNGMRMRDRGAGWAETIDWYVSRGAGQREYKLKAVIPSFIHAVCEVRSFRSVCRPPIIYEGFRKARMLHFVFEFEPERTPLRAFSHQDDRDLIELPLLRSENGMLVMAPQHPGFDFARCGSSLEFLSDQARESIVSTRPTGAAAEARS